MALCTFETFSRRPYAEEFTQRRTRALSAGSISIALFMSITPESGSLATSIAFMATCGRVEISPTRLSTSSRVGGF